MPNDEPGEFDPNSQWEGLFGSPSPEAFAAMRKRVEDQAGHQKMHQDSKLHELVSFLAGLSDDGREALVLLLSVIVANPEVARYYLGLLSGLGQAKGVCFFHGVDHFKDELSATLGEPDA